jgi:hypothetical protein
MPPRAAVLALMAIIAAGAAILIGRGLLGGSAAGGPRTGAIPAVADAATRPRARGSRRLTAQTAPEQRAVLEHAFGRDPVDTAWASAATAAARSSLESHLDERSRVDSVECRRSLCMSRLTHLDEHAYRTFLQRASRHELWRGPVFIARASADGETPVKMVVFLAREGIELPIATQMNE